MSPALFSFSTFAILLLLTSSPSSVHSWHMQQALMRRGSFLRASSSQIIRQTQNRASSAILALSSAERSSHLKLGHHQRRRRDQQPFSLLPHFTATTTTSWSSALFSTSPSCSFPTEYYYSFEDTMKDPNHTEYEHWVRRLYQTNLFHPVKLGLENMQQLHSLLGNPMDDTVRTLSHDYELYGCCQLSILTRSLDSLFYTYFIRTRSKSFTSPEPMARARCALKSPTPCKQPTN